MHITHLIAIAAVCVTSSATGPQADPSQASTSEGGGQGKVIRIPISMSGRFRFSGSSAGVELDMSAASSTSHQLKKQFSYEIGPPNATNMMDLSRRTPTNIPAPLNVLPRASLTQANEMFQTKVYIGDPRSAESFHGVRMVLKTGDPASWVVGPTVIRGTDDQHPPDQGHLYYDPAMSGDMTDEDCTMHYNMNTAYVRGKYAIDSLLLGGGTKPAVLSLGVLLCVADQLSPQFRSDVFAADGSLGLGPPTTEELSSGFSFLQTLRDSNVIEKPMISFKMSWKPGESELVLGGMDPNHFVNFKRLIHISVCDTPGTVKLWAICLNFLSLKRFRATAPRKTAMGPATISEGPQLSYIESGSPYIQLPLEIADRLIRLTRPYERHPQPNNNDGIPIDLPFRSLVLSRDSDRPDWCLAAILGVPNLGSIVLGQSFMTVYYVVLRFPDGGPLMVTLAEAKY